jgi:hypothetical protein
LDFVTQTQALMREHTLKSVSKCEQVVDKVLGGVVVGNPLFLTRINI